MSIGLLERFFTEEYAPDLDSLLESALNDLRADAEAMRKYEFNLFELTFDVMNSSVTIEDVLDPSDSGTEIIEMSEFAAAFDRFRNKGN